MPPASGRWRSSFETYLQAFPKSAQSDDAQFYIGEALQLDGKFKEAITAFEKVTTDYPQGDQRARCALQARRHVPPQSERQGARVVRARHQDVS